MSDQELRRGLQILLHAGGAATLDDETLVAVRRAVVGELANRTSSKRDFWLIQNLGPEWVGAFGASKGEQATIRTSTGTRRHYVTGISPLEDDEIIPGHPVQFQVSTHCRHGVLATRDDLRTGVGLEVDCGNCAYASSTYRVKRRRSRKRKRG